MSGWDLILFLLIAGGVAWLAERFNVNAPRWISLGVLIVSCVVVLGLWLGGADASGFYDRVEMAWIPRFGISVLLYMDGLSLMLVGLTVLLGVVAVVSSWSEISERHGFFQANLLWTLAGVVGVFTAMDLFLFFVFWEVMLVPMYFLIAIYGGANRAKAATKFFIFTFTGSMITLAGLVYVAWQYWAFEGAWSFDIPALTAYLDSVKGGGS